jgi:hypothetical protein
MFTTIGLCSFAMLRKVAMSTGPLSGALFIGGTVSVCATDDGAKSRREAMTIPTAAEATASKTA